MYTYSHVYIHVCTLVVRAQIVALVSIRTILFTLIECIEWEGGGGRGREVKTTKIPDVQLLNKY